MFKMESSSTSTHQLSAHNIGDLIDSVDAFLFDCDGVIWKGDFLIYGGKKLVFVTNNSTKSRSQYAKKFQSLGISVSQDEIFSSSFAAAMFLKVHKFPQDKKVYVIGGEGILEELQLAGFTSFGGPEDDEKLAELKPNSLFEHDKSVGAVVVGLDPRINYYKLQYGTLCIRENPGCVFIATNRDSVGHMTNLQEWPGAGCMVAAICGSTQKEPIVVGKPSTFMMDFLLERYNISCSRMCMVGDRLDTDILFGRNAGCKTLLVLSGVTTLPTLEDPSNTIQPDYYTSKRKHAYKFTKSPLKIKSKMNSSSPSTHQLSAHNIGDLIDSVDAFLFDCDGVIWKGDSLIDGGKKLVFVTNNSTKSRSQYAKKFQSLGISVNQDEIFSSSFAAAMFLKVRKFPQDKKVYVIGGEGILEELQLAGFTGLGGPEDGEKTAELKPNSLFEHDKSVGAVVVGLDPRINYYKLQYGTLCIRENPGCLFIATNRDSVGHMTNLQEWPGAGCMVAAICGSTQKEPIVVGKPSTFMMDFLLERYNISCSRMCMVGDRLDTDILFGQNAGCKTLLVLSGVTTLPTLEDPSNTILPDYYTSKFITR
ncbi:hypothetical protein G4B88_010560 [Cannabis sativa]|uniref:phosphoglycolate phosphatase n=1 Tax=Cannabis sativa TaxID=3483 RepID=A0A7J6G872_CANSA|nr:hypothetical protein G4B88_010560 [Cannabis sativa]